MGLDQNAWITRQPFDPTSDIEPAIEKEFYWRKHTRLQSWVLHKWMDRLDIDADPEQLDIGFNGAMYEFTKDDILELLQLVSDEELPWSPGGFFWGQQWQEETMRSYREQDIEFCHTAIKAINAGKHVTYYNDY